MPEDKKKAKKPQPWYLGFGLARFAGESIKKSRKKKAERLAKMKKE